MSVPARVFISYSHDSHVSGAHRERVLALAQALRTHGIDVDFDQFHETEIVDWPSWCRRGLGPCNAERTQGSDFVLCVCSQGYFDGIENLVPPERNKGVYWEGRLLQQRMYDDKGNGRYLPVLLDGAPLSVIPEVLRGWTRVELGRFDPDDPDYEALLRILSGEHPVIPVELGAFPDLRRFATHRLPEHGARLGFIGRQPELAVLNAAWADTGRTRLLTLIAPGGTGKTALVLHWLSALRDENWRGAQRVFGWSFYSQGTAEDRQASEEPFLRAALEFFRVQLSENASAYEKGEKLAAAIARSRTLLILDGLEPLQAALGGSLRAAGVATLLQALVRNARADQPCLCVLTSRQPVIEFAAELRDAAHPLRPVQTIPLDNLSPADGALLLYRLGVQRAGQGAIAEAGAAQEAELQQASEAFKNHALTLTVLGNYLASAWHGDVRCWREVELAAAEPDFRFDADAEYGHAFKAMFAYERWLASDPRKGTQKLAVLRLLGLFDRPATPDCLRALLRAPVIDGLTEALSGIAEAEW
ncbi:toll/interleukin-1 receptor domain-containing protein, partial [Plasticicumulans sp.]|uniref:toll/interleukin-1 receptor domain-containing protein n=1 Tax=Plasticicumulans sp. TaxID=2307179 RepID=UPI00392A8EC1